jgi:C_GCAxxG_C_C family probable redox protein
MNAIQTAEARFREHYSCSQAVFSALAEQWGIDPDLALRIAAGFGGGLARSGGPCGCVTGAIMALGLAGPGAGPGGNPEAREKTYELSGRFLREFERRNGSTLCPELLGCDLSTPEGLAEARQKDLFQLRCTQLVRDAVEIAEGLLAGAAPPCECRNRFEALGRQDLLRALDAFARNWLAHDGCWFLAAETRFGMETAIELDTAAWEQFAAAEARRIMSTFGIPPNGGLAALERALGFRMYGVINRQHVEWSDDRQRLRFYMDECRVQQARERKGLPAFPCKSVGMVEFTTFAKTIDARIVTGCLECPPESPMGKYCGWEFVVL